ncbi:hypothetical protein C8R43DRAFT_1140884 [Mycena crocata]|nr:hypothetical protein C8R43DRAFT_1140884 [Mycena crocata]
MSASVSMSTKHQHMKTNIRADEIEMDGRGKRDSRYYCVPPFYGAANETQKMGRGFRYHLVFQGHQVGIFDNWGEAKLSLSGFENSGNRGFDTLEGALDAWQKMCTWGVHPHPVDPAFVKTPSESISGFVNTSPRKGPSSSRSSPVKREGSAGPANAQVLADLKHYCSPILPPSSANTAQRGSPVQEHPPFVNFAIRGAGIVSSSAERSQQRYLDLQRRGEQPDLLVTRSFEQASLFALEEDEVDGADEDDV